MFSHKLNALLGLLLAALVVVAAFGASVESAFADDAALRAKVSTLLGGFEYVPTPEEWAALGPEAAEILRQTAADASQLASTRARAVSALAHFDDPSNRPFLEGLLADASQPEILRRNAVTVLSLRHGPEALPLIKPLLASESFTMRETAVRATAQIAAGGPANPANPEAKAILEAHLAAEPSDSIKTIIKQSLHTAP